MEITDIETVLLSREVPRDKASRAGGIHLPPQVWLKSDMLIVKLHTDEGVVGLGEPSPYGGVQKIARAVEDLKPTLVGKDPANVDQLTDPGSWYDRQFLGGPGRMALAGINQACWDAVGKATGKPVYELLGGLENETLDAYASGGNDWSFVEDPDLLVEEALGYKRQGFDAFKLRIGADDRFVDAIAQVREAVGDDFDLMIEGNMRFRNASEAISYARKFAVSDPYWFEEPVSGDDRAGYQEIRRALPDVHITGGEAHTSVHDFTPWIDGRAYDIVQPDANVLGISETKAVADLAHLEGLLCAPHNWHNAINRAANIHVAAAIPNVDRIEMNQTWHAGCPAFREEIVTDPILPEDGMIEVPDRPGLGIELDEAAIEQYPYKEGPMAEPWDDHPF